MLSLDQDASVVHAFQMSDHTHTHSRLRASKTCRLGTVLLLTIAYCIVELICGHNVHSVAIIADAIHMLSDSGALMIAMVSVWVSENTKAEK